MTLMLAQFKSGDKLWATAIRVNSMVFPAEILIAAKTKKELREAVEAFHCDCDAKLFKKIILTPNNDYTPARRATDERKKDQT